MPAVPLFIMDPLWSQFEVLIPPVLDDHPLGCHRPRIPNRVVFESWFKCWCWVLPTPQISDATCSATTIRRRRDERIAAGIFTALQLLGTRVQ